MSVTYCYLAMESECGAVLDWFRKVVGPPRIVATDRGVAMYFENLGSLVGFPGPIDSKSSPIVTVFVPRRRRGVLLTAGEVHFLATHLRKQFPALDGISQDFGRWLRQFDCVFSRSSRPGEWDYFLEGSLRNFDSEIRALPGAMAALRGGQYFVADDDTPISSTGFASRSDCVAWWGFSMPSGSEFADMERPRQQFSQVVRVCPTSSRAAPRSPVPPAPMRGARSRPSFRALV